VFGGVEGIVVTVGPEVLGKVDRQLADRVAVVFDAFSCCMVVLPVSISAGGDT